MRSINKIRSSIVIISKQLYNMKKTGFLSLIVLLLVSTINIGWVPQPQAIKEGAITYKVAFDSDDVNPMVKFMLDGSEMVIRFKDHFIRTELEMSMISTTTIVDSEKQQGIMLMSAMGNNMAVKMGEKDLKQQNPQAENVKITYLDDTKEIVGYVCKKAIMTITAQNGQSGELTMYYTEEILPENMNTQYTVQGMKGFPLQFEMNMQGTKVNMVAEQVSEENQDSALFSTEIPEGYSEMSMEDINRMQGK